MTTVTWETLPIVLLTIAVAVLGVARLTRVAVYDDFPPAVWIRDRWVGLTDGTGWQQLALCWWCLAFWVALLCIAWWIAAIFVVWIAWSWWIFWGALALGYLAPMVIVRDTPEE